jgi:hypothetical protein
MDRKWVGEHTDMTASFSRRACANSGSSVNGRSSSCVCFKRCREFCRRAVSIDTRGQTDRRRGEIRGSDELRGATFISCMHKLI